jgi:hypothetical protein
MVSWAAMRTRVYALTDLDDSRASSTVIDDWMKRAIVEVSALMDTIPQFWDAMSPLESLHQSTVNAASFVVSAPTDSIRVHPDIKVGNRIARLPKSASFQSNVTDEIHQPTIEAPEVAIVAHNQAYSKYHVYPHSFADKQVTFRYLKDAAGTESFIPNVAEAIALKAAEIGMTELKDNGRAGDMAKRFEVHVSMLIKAEE